MNIDVCDFHAHILPGVDHGSTNLKMSISQLLLAQRCGVCRIVASPHFYAHKESVGSFIERRNWAYEMLKNELPEEMTVALGAEVLLCDNMENLPGLELLTIGSSNVILLELPYGEITEAHFCTVSELISKGYKVVIAHAERYNPLHIDELCQLGAKLQLNADAISPRFFKPSAVKQWLASGVVCSIGSDIHGLGKKSYIHFVNAVLRNTAFMFEIKKKSDLLWSGFKAE